MERLAILHIPTFELRMLHNDLCLCYKIIKGLVNINLKELFTLADCCNTTRGHSLKLIKPHAHVNGRLFFYAVRIVDIWNSLPADVIESGTYNLFKDVCIV